MGKIFYDMGFLATPDVIECSATDLIGQYVGQTCPKTRRALERALGKVLFIDEAWRLSFGEFAAQAVDEIIQFLSQPTHAGRIVVILAGFNVDMNLLMRQYPALSGLFPEEICFENLEPAECITLLLRELGHSKFVTENGFLLNHLNKDYIAASRLFKALQIVPGWGNARDVKHLAKRILAKFLEAPMPGSPEMQAERIVTAQQVHSSLFELIKQRQERTMLMSADANTSLPMQPPIGSDVTASLHAPPQLATPVDVDVDVDVDVSTGVQAASSRQGEAHIETSAKTKLQAQIQERRRPRDHIDDYQGSSTGTSEPPAFREEGVSDADWAQIQEAKEKETQDHRRGKELERELNAAETALLENGTGGGNNCGGLNSTCDALRNKLSAHERMILQKKEIQKQIQHMGRCIMGFQWHQVGGGWRCAGGSHFIHDHELRGRVAV